MAKRQAAHKMLQTLKSMPVERESEQSLAMIDEDDLAQGIGKNLWLTRTLYCKGTRVSEPKKWLVPNFIFKGWE